MTKRKNVIKRLEEISDYFFDVYHRSEDREAKDRCDAVEDALTMLKEQDNCENCAMAIEDRQLVVRCKDCKYWRQLYGDKSSIGCCDCDDMWRSFDGEITEVNNIITDSDFYCGYAERR